MRCDCSSIYERETAEFALERVACDLCGCTQSERYLRLKDRIRGVPGEFTLEKCRNCGLVYLNPRPIAETLTRLYEGYHGAAPSIDTRSTRNLSGGFKKYFLLRRGWHILAGQYLGEVLQRLHGDILDIGCGTGDLLVLAQERGCRAYGLEFNPTAVEICHQRGLDKVRQGVLDAGTFPEKSFDVITLWHVLEHLPSPRRTLEEIHRILKPGGILFISAPNLNAYLRRIFKQYWAGWHVPFHLYHFTPETLGRLSTRCGFVKTTLQSATSEMFFHASINSYLRRHPDNVCLFVNRAARTLPCRLIISLAFRCFDRFLHGRGETLRAELGKPA